MYSCICIIGLGGLGGFLAKNLSELETTKKLILIDYDKVESENIKNSIYTKKDIGLFKTEAIFKKIENDIETEIINEKFIENLSNIPQCDLILDCRDFTYERINIDARLYMTFRTLIIDCRKNVKYSKQYEGKYLSRLSKADLNLAALNTTILIGNGIFSLLLKNQTVHEIPIDYISENTKSSVEKNKNDIIYDNNNFEGKLINLHKNYSSIIDINKKNDLTICVGSKVSPYVEKNISKNKFMTINDIISNFHSILKTIPFQFNYYIITIVNHNGRFYIELLPETGSA